MKLKSFFWMFVFIFLTVNVTATIYGNDSFNRANANPVSNAPGGNVNWTQTGAGAPDATSYIAINDSMVWSRCDSCAAKNVFLSTNDFTAGSKSQTTFRAKTSTAANQWGLRWYDTNDVLLLRITFDASNQDIRINSGGWQSLVPFVDGYWYNITAYINTVDDTCNVTINGTNYNNGGAQYALENVGDVPDWFRISDDGSSLSLNYFDRFCIADNVDTECFVATPNVPPAIILNTPANGVNTSNSSLIFSYNYTDSENKNGSCNLTIDSVVVDEQTDVTSGTKINYTWGNYTFGSKPWNVTCSDGDDSNTSTTRDLTIIKSSGVTEIDLSDNTVSHSWLGSELISDNVTSIDSESGIFIVGTDKGASLITSDVPTAVELILFDLDLNQITQPVDEGDDVYVGANWTRNDSGVQISNGTCNFTIENVYYESNEHSCEVDRSVYSECENNYNFSIYSTKYLAVNVTTSDEDVSDADHIHIYFPVCILSTAGAKPLNVYLNSTDMSVSSSTLIDSIGVGEVSLCSAGYTMVEINTSVLANDDNLSIMFQTDGKEGRAWVIHGTENYTKNNTYVGSDGESWTLNTTYSAILNVDYHFVTHTENNEGYSSTFGAHIINHVYEWYDHGLWDINITCGPNISAFINYEANFTAATVNITNLPPRTGFQQVLHSNGTNYSLTDGVFVEMGNFNVTFFVNDDDLDYASINFTNRTGTQKFFNNTGLRNVRINASNLGDGKGVYNFTIFANDTDADTNTSVVWINVSDNTAPSGTVPTQNMTEDVTYTFLASKYISDVFTNVTGTNLSWELIFSSNESRVNCSMTVENLSDGNITAIPGPDWNSGDDRHPPALGLCNFDVTDISGSNTTYNFNVSFNVSAVNDGPRGMNMNSPSQGARTTGNNVSLNVSCYDIDNKTVNIYFMGNQTTKPMGTLNITSSTDNTTFNHTTSWNWITTDAINYTWWFNCSDGAVMNTTNQFGELNRTFIENNRSPMPSLSTPTNGSITTFATNTLTWVSGGTDSEGDVTTYYVYHENVTSPALYGTTTSVSSIISLSSMDEYYWRIRAYDGYEFSNYTGLWWYNYTVNTAPTINFSLPTPDNNTWNTDGFAIINVTVSDAEDNIDSVTLTVEGLDTTIVNNNGSGGTYSYWINHSFSEGNSSYNVTVLDVHLFSAVTETRLLKVDSLTPSISHSDGLTDNNTVINRNYTQINLSFSDTNLDYVVVNFNGTSYTNTTATSAWFLNLTDLSEGNYSWYYMAYDLAGNYNRSLDLWTFIDVAAPVINITLSETRLQWNETNQSINVTITDVSTVSYNINVTNASNYQIYSTSSTKNIFLNNSYMANYGIGNFTVSVFANDTLSNTSTNTTFNISYLTIGWNYPENDSQTITVITFDFNWTLSTINFDTQIFSFNGTSYTPSSDDNLIWNVSIYNWTDGTYNYTLFVNTTKTSYNVTRSVTIQNGPISIGYCGDITNLSFSYNISNFNWTSETLTEYNVSSTRQSTYNCTYNLSLAFTTNISLYMTSDVDDSQFRLKCDHENNLSNANIVNATTNPFMGNYTTDDYPLISCWLDRINANKSLTINVTFNGTLV
jgi:hypothetical protein